jgi:glycosyltransferase involved in cell wall biosynthesis
MKVGIAILSYFRLDRLQKCVGELLENTEMPFDLFIVDNCSDEETVAYLRWLHSQGIASICLNEKNVGWMMAKNQCLAMLEGYDVQILMENDVTCRSLIPRVDWIQLHLQVMEVLSIPILHGRHSVKEHPDEGLLIRVEKAGFKLRLHDEILSRMLIFKKGVAERVGAFNWQMSMPWGAFVDVEWSDRVLRAYEEETGLVFGVSLDESIFEFQEILGDDYPDASQVRALSLAVHRPIFMERRRYTWDSDVPELFIPLRGVGGA